MPALRAGCALTTLPPSRRVRGHSERRPGCAVRVYSYPFCAADPQSEVLPASLSSSEDIDASASILCRLRPGKLATASSILVGEGSSAYGKGGTPRPAKLAIASWTSVGVGSAAYRKGGRSAGGRISSDWGKYPVSAGASTAAADAVSGWAAEGGRCAAEQAAPSVDAVRTRRRSRAAAARCGDRRWALGCPRDAVPGVWIQEWRRRYQRCSGKGDT